MRARRFALLFTLACVLVGLPVAAASPWRDLHVEVTNMFNVPGPFPFTATGQAVSEGLVCPAGLESTGSVTVSPSPDGEQFLLLSAIQHWECAGGGIDNYIVVTLDLESGNSWGDWRILAGTGVYAGVRGSGKLVGTRLPSGDGIHDVWDGKVSLDPVATVYIEVPTPLPAGPAIPFWASGSAVARGYICAEGTVASGPTTWSPSPDGDRFAILTMFKYFACDGGTFDVRLSVTLDNWTGSTVGTWRVTGGSGSCADLKGNGTIVGTFDPSTYSVFDVYDGKIRR